MFLSKYPLQTLSRNSFLSTLGKFWQDATRWPTQRRNTNAKSFCRSSCAKTGANGNYYRAPGALRPQFPYVNSGKCWSSGFISFFSTTTMGDIICLWLIELEKGNGRHRRHQAEESLSPLGCKHPAEASANHPAPSEPVLSTFMSPVTGHKCPHCSPQPVLLPPSQTSLSFRSS